MMYELSDLWQVTKSLLSSHYVINNLLGTVSTLEALEQQGLLRGALLRNFRFCFVAASG